jgi:hypothetical protein
MKKKCIYLLSYLLLLPLSSMFSQDNIKINGQIRYRFETAKKDFDKEIQTGIDYLSGDDNIDGKTYKVFNTLYSTNHKFYGIMDYFIDIPEPTGGYGLTDIFAGLSAVFYKKSKAQMRYHRFLSSKKYLLPNNSQASTFGDEIDIIVNYMYNKFLKIEAGGGLFFPGTIFKATNGKGTGSFFYWSFLANL